MEMTLWPLRFIEVSVASSDHLFLLYANAVKKRRKIETIMGAGGGSVWEAEKSSEPGRPALGRPRLSEPVVAQQIEKSHL